MNTENNKNTGFDTESIDRLNSIVDGMGDLMDEFKKICKNRMSASEYQQFKYRTLGHIEPVINNDPEWYNKYSFLDSLQKVVDGLYNTDEDNEVEEDESD